MATERTDDIQKTFGEHGTLELPFATPLYTAKAGNDAVQKEIANAMPNINFVNTPDSWGVTQQISKPASNVLFGGDIVAEHGLTSTQAMIQHHVKVFLAMGGFPDVSIASMQSWFTKNNKGAYSRSHDHGDADVCGTYYFKTTGEDGSIYFLSPAPAHSTNRFFANCARDVVFKPYEGGLLLFPSWLHHGVQTNTTDSTRISLSFNVFLKR